MLDATELEELRVWALAEAEGDAVWATRITERVLRYVADHPEETMEMCWDEMYFGAQLEDNPEKS